MVEKNTKELILEEALKLYAYKGYLATSMSDIANQINVSKQALYKHYQNKQAILDSIVDRMEQIYAQRIKQYEMPEGSFEQVALLYQTIPVKKIKEFTVAQFEYWTKDEFASQFRKMVTLEQYRSQMMAYLYKRYLIDGPIEYMTQIFSRMLGDDEAARQFAYAFYSPIYMLYSEYDHAADKQKVIKSLEKHVAHFSNYFETVRNV